MKKSSILMIKRTDKNVPILGPYSPDIVRGVFVMLKQTARQYGQKATFQIVAV